MKLTLTGAEVNKAVADMLARQGFLVVDTSPVLEPDDLVEVEVEVAHAAEEDVSCELHSIQ